MSRPQRAGSRLRLIGSSCIFVGLVLLALAVWCVTTLNGPSFNVNTFAGTQPTAHDYLLLVVEIALALAGAFSVFFGIVTLRKSQKQLTFARSMHLVDVEFETDPRTSAPGRCWQCGRKIHAGSTICLVCGAAQNLRARRVLPGDSANRYGWDLAATSPDAANSFSGPLASPPGAMPPMDPSQPPAYQPGARPGWYLPNEPPAGDETGPGPSYPWR